MRTYWRIALVPALAAALALWAGGSDTALADVNLTPGADDDAFVEGGLCVGTACVDGQTFQADLEIVDAFPSLQFEQSTSGHRWIIHGWGAIFTIVENGLTGPFTIRTLTPTDTLVLDSTGNIGMGTDLPISALDVRRSSATADIFAGLGVNPTTGPSFNYGYAGATFGRSAGFFNVRPDASAVAPNPSLRFMTANVERMIIDNEGFVGLGVANPTSPIHHSSGAVLTAGGAWTNASSRAVKQDIVDLGVEEALETVRNLQPVTFAYNANPSDRVAGFIAEDVPELVATPDRTGLSAMDIVAVLTRVVQEQDRTIGEQRVELAGLRQLVGDLAGRVATLEAR